MVAQCPNRVGPLLIAVGALFFVAERFGKGERDMAALHWTDAAIIGMAQTCALVPGVSRSGATILGGELLGVERKAAAEFTFYLAVPTMLGASVFDLYQNRDIINFDAGLLIAIGFVVSFLVAWVVVKTFIGFVGRYGLRPFGWYRIAAGGIILAIMLL